jgi:hypothetical protein
MNAMRCPLTRRRIGAILATLLLLVPSTASAQETEGERLFREGRARMLEGKLDEACPMLEQSQKLEPHVGTLLNLAACHEHQGKVGSAWTEYQKALTAARAEGQSERAQLAEKRIAALDPRVPWLRITTTVEDASITIDGGLLAPVALGQEMPVDPGAHVVIAERRGTKIFEERVEMREAEHRTLHVGVYESLGPDPRLVIEPKPSEVEPPKTPPQARGRWILEPGIFVGYFAGSQRFPISNEGNRIGLVSDDPRLVRTTCAERNCSYGELDNTGNGTAGLTVFVGYALSEYVDLGLRIVAAPSVGSGWSGMWAFGPSVSLHATDSLSIGLWGLFGDASLRGVAAAKQPSGFRFENSNVVAAEGTLAGGFGLGLEIALKLADIGTRGSLRATAMPFFIGGSSGNAFALPLGVAYRFQ